LVSRAAVALGDDSRVPVLEEMYMQLPAIGMQPGEFSTLIRPMAAPAVRRLQIQASRDQGNEVKP
jgi:hypothetical protein